MLTLVLPTYNEAANLPGILEAVTAALGETPHEVIVVDDDSPDGTWRLAEELRSAYPRLRVLRRTDKRGLSSAVVDGFLMGNGTVLAVMDADGQHDSALIKHLYEKVRDRSGIAIGSRYVEGGDVGEWDGGRHRMSKMATALAMRVLRRPEAAKVRDPMSGFFAIDRKAFHDAHPRLNPKGFKILLDLLLNVPAGTDMHELPMRFGKRMAGKSKLDWKVQWEYLEYLYDVTLGRFVSLWTLAFGVVLTAVLCALGLRLIPLLPLYRDQALRAQVVPALQTFARERGWLLSDTSINAVHPQDGSFVVLYSPHPPRGQQQLCNVVPSDIHASTCVSL